MQNFCLNEKRTRKRQVSLLLESKICLCAAVSLPSVLSGCSASLPTVQKCPEPNPVPAEIAKSDLPDAQSYSARVSDWLERVENYLKGSLLKKMQ